MVSYLGLVMCPRNMMPIPDYQSVVKTNAGVIVFELAWIQHCICISSLYVLIFYTLNWTTDIDAMIQINLNIIHATWH